MWYVVYKLGQFVIMSLTLLQLMHTCLVSRERRTHIAKDKVSEYHAKERARAQVCTGLWRQWMHVVQEEC